MGGIFQNLWSFNLLSINVMTKILYCMGVRHKFVTLFTEKSQITLKDKQCSEENIHTHEVPNNRRLNKNC